MRDRRSSSLFHFFSFVFLSNDNPPQDHLKGSQLKWRDNQYESIDASPNHWPLIYVFLLRDIMWHRVVGTTASIAYHMVSVCKRGVTKTNADDDIRPSRWALYCLRSNASPLTLDHRRTYDYSVMNTVGPLRDAGMCRQLLRHSVLQYHLQVFLLQATIHRNEPGNSFLDRTEEPLLLMHLSPTWRKFQTLMAHNFLW